MPLVEADEMRMTKTSRFEQVLDDYQMLAREPLIYGTQCKRPGRPRLASGVGRAVIAST